MNSRPERSSVALVPGYFDSKPLSMAFKSCLYASSVLGHSALDCLKPFKNAYVAVSLSVQKYKGLTRWTKPHSSATPVLGPSLALLQTSPLSKFSKNVCASSSKLWPVTSLSKPSSRGFLLSKYLRRTPQIEQLFNGTFFTRAAASISSKDAP